MCILLREHLLSVNKFHVRLWEWPDVPCAAAAVAARHALAGSWAMPEGWEGPAHRITQVGRAIWRSSSPTHCSGPRPVEFWVSLRMVNATTSLGNLWQCLTTLMVGKFLLSYVWIGFPVFQNLCPLPFVLWPVTSEKSLTVFFTPPLRIYTQWWVCPWGYDTVKSLTGVKTCQYRVGQNLTSLILVSPFSG